MWAPHTAQGIDKVEIIQRRVARFVYKKYYCSVTWLAHSTSEKKLPQAAIDLKAMISIPSNNFKPITLNTRGYQSHFQCLQTTCDIYFPGKINLVGILTKNQFVCRVSSYQQINGRWN